MKLRWKNGLILIFLFLGIVLLIWGLPRLLSILFKNKESVSNSSKIIEFLNSAEASLKKGDIIAAVESARDVLSLDNRNRESLRILGSIPTAPWPTFKGNLRRDGLSKYIGPKLPYLKWHFKCESFGERYSLVAQDNFIYFYSTRGLFCLNDKGEKLWSYDFESSAIKPAFTLDIDGTIFLVPVDPKNPCFLGRLLRFDKHSNNLENYPIEIKNIAGNAYPRMEIVPTITKAGNKYLNLTNPPCFAVLSHNGSLKEVIKDLDAAGIAAVSDDRMVILHGSDGTESKVYSIGLDNNIKWCKTISKSSGISNPAIGKDGTIYVVCNHKLHAISQEGSFKWQWGKEKDLGLSPVLASDGTIYICSFPNYIHAIGVDGVEKWELQLDKAVGAPSPLIDANGTIYVSCGKVYAINSDGTMKWEYTTEDTCRSNPSMDSNGTLYIFDSEYLYAIGEKKQ